MPHWVTERIARYIHADQLAEHGGLDGPSREGALEATLARARHLHEYAPRSSLERLAAAYGYGLARDHCYPDGNKRLALAVMDVFLRLNGRQLTAAEEDAVVTIVAVAGGQISEDELAEWVGANSSALAD